ncbi:MAG: D-xylose ABC transporter ATP-binding protein [Acidobacteria bacterium]|nr:MAG: D-xylose ABC transporter ATP-binding protein [Acidobacteriota bacterium]
MSLLEMSGITKHFPGVLALDNAHLSVEAGECHALVGENGAGKSTLMKILSGAYRADAGLIKLDGETKHIDSPIAARRLGITMIHQELNLLPELTVAENIFLGHEVVRGPLGWLDKRAMEKRSQELLESLGQKLSGRALIKKISLAQQQMVEIAKALSVKSKIIIMDEPSSILTDRELHELFDLISRLKQQNVAIIYISHRLEEIFKICERVTVMRDGRTIQTEGTGKLNQDQIIRLMVGREIEQFSPSQHSHPGEEILRLEAIEKAGKLHNIHLGLRKGEIVGLTGLVGAGRTELARVIFGADQPDSGRILLEGKPVSLRSPRQAIDLGIGLLTEDRKTQGLILNMMLRENTTLARLSRLVKRGFINVSAERSVTKKFIRDLLIKTPSTEQKVRNLSGGTQQKVVLAKWLFTESKILIFDEPTRGIDVGAKAEIYQLMWKLVSQGIAILMISSELPEILKMCERILVMHDGEITGELKREEADQEKIMALAMGLNHLARTS